MPDFDFDENAIPLTLNARNIVNNYAGATTYRNQAIPENHTRWRTGAAQMDGAINPTTQFPRDLFEEATEDEVDAITREFSIPYPKEYKKKNVVEFKLSLEAKDAIFSISEAIIKDLKALIIEKLQLRVNLTLSENYNDLRGLVATDNIPYEELFLMQNSFNNLQNKKALTNKADNFYLSKLIEESRKLYDIEYSKYKYYPRLKAKIKYGNTELLEEILTFTQFNKGIVVW